MSSTSWLARSKGSSLLIPFLLIALFFNAAVFSRFRLNEPGDLHVNLLFSIPPLLQALGLSFLRRESFALRVFYSLSSLLSFGSYLAAWYYYMAKLDSARYSSVYCLLASLGLVMLASFTTGLAFRRDGSTRSLPPESLAGSIGRSPGAEVLLHLAYFISIAYLLAFAFAFHDRAQVLRGDLPGLIGIPAEGDASPVDRMNNASVENRWQVFFDIASFTLDPSGPNASALRSVRQQIAEYGGRPVRITLIGVSDGRRLVPTGPFSSNLELSSARIQSVQEFLIDSIAAMPSQPQVNWLLTPFVVDEISPRARRVEILVEPLITGGAEGEIRLLNLIGYVYFSVYTITTTGYGDIRPSTPHAMFICTLANLYEIFFVLIFFNVLMSARRNEAANPANQADGLRRR